MDVNVMDIDGQHHCVIRPQRQPHNQHTDLRHTERAALLDPSYNSLHRQNNKKIYFANQQTRNVNKNITIKMY